MELNRNQYFFLGIVILLMGIQLRIVSSFVLTEDATKFLAQHTQSSAENSALTVASSLGAGRKVIEPPDWLGWCLISVGSVLILHSLAMRRPDS